MSTGMHNYGSGGRTWAEWRERNRTGRDAYYDRMEAADQCLATCPVCWTRCDMPEGHLYAHQFEGKCVSRQLDEVSDLEGERVNLVYWDEETDLRKMQAKVNEMVAQMAELQQHYGYTWVGNPETGEWRLRREAQE